MAEKRGGLAGRVGRRVNVSYNYPSKGAEYSEIPGIANFSIGQGEAASDTISAFEGSFTILGEAPIGDVNFTVVSYLPNHRAWADIEEAFAAGDPLNWRIVTPERIVLAQTPMAVTAAIVAVTGVVNFVGDITPILGATVQRGMSLVVAGKKYTIRKIDIAAAGDALVVGGFVVDPAPAAAVAAAPYSFLLPSLQWQFNGGVKQTGSVEGGVETAIGSTLIVTPTSRIGLPTVV